MEGFPKQEKKFEIIENSPESEYLLSLNRAMDSLFEYADSKSKEEAKKILGDYVKARTEFEIQLEERGVSGEKYYLWHILVGGTPDGRIESFDTTDEIFKNFFQENLFLKLEKGQ
jgi:hypothetical protein